MNEQPLLAHLIELRTRLVRAAAGLLIVFLALFHWSGDIYHLLAKPLLDVLPSGSNMIATDVTAPFFVPVKVTMLVAFLISLPNTLYQIWAFVAPGLYAHEKRLILPLVVSSVVLFFTGMAFAYFLVFPVVFGFMSSVTPQGVAMMTDIDKYLSFVLGMFVAFGVTFEVPIVVILLTRMGIVTVEKLRAGRPYVIVGAFVVAAVVTPPDVLSQIMLALPLWLLYEFGIIMAIFFGRQPKRETA
ncbi:sec-independent protein translocase, TatC subunit [Pseudogulbenkiania sp. NH8B]|uniref:Sec-independent protein translocase protein TatC n=1 Tax=Pseudogulbenkiania ferrooxidans 2002 TaxID=279714 RepID=B9YYC2_9NEIS|nr:MULTISPECIES: twin-arginine translocase subunit TatC [Pseudogulbenkiania]EEG10125.1 Sec-independent protein translocase, TatC subunit [Pseudogulbenkiania ferrooxidans 2002]BAK78569.1 sec-independent protein translocase, TatC subunit [Pseudogulbenkiania sp. NH8B]